MDERLDWLRWLCYKESGLGLGTIAVGLVAGLVGRTQLGGIDRGGGVRVVSMMGV